MDSTNEKNNTIHLFLQGGASTERLIGYIIVAYFLVLVLFLLLATYWQEL